MTSEPSFDQLKIQKWIETKYSADDIRDQLRLDGYDDEKIQAYVKQYLKIRYAKRNRIGLILTVVGATIGFLSCILTLMNAAPAYHDFILFGLTSVSLVMVFAGLVLVLE